VNAAVFGGLRELKRAWHPAETNLRCSGISRVGVLNPNIVPFIAFDIAEK